MSVVHSYVMENFVIRRANTSEQRELEDLQLRASLTNAGDRDALLAHPVAIDVPLRQITAGSVFVAEWNGAIVGFATVESRPIERANWIHCLSTRTRGVVGSGNR